MSYKDIKHNKPQTSRDNRSRHREEVHLSKKPRHSSPERFTDIQAIIKKHRRELSSFLQNRLNIKNVDDFWKFFEKYQTIQAVKTIEKSNFDKKKSINLDFDSNFEDLYSKLCVRISKEVFRNFVNTVLVYQDFQQKTKFLKLKKLRAAQNDLPIAQYKTRIIEALQESKVVLIAGDTGCGKSTQVPQYIIEAGYNKVVCTQPRRIACVSLSKRVAYETLAEFKTMVGYQIRFEKTKRADTSVVFMTEGLLLRQAAEEETISTYDVIILDEIHERHLYGDFLIGIMKCLLHKRDDFKLILMSATINIQLFQDYFFNEGIKVIEVPGRLYPIDIQYRPIIKDAYQQKKDKFDCSPYLQIIQMIDEKYPLHHRGDLLIFLNGIAEITTLANAVNEYSSIKKNWIVLQLHSTLSLEEQDKVFDYPPEGIRKCIISTNIAETSVTIDGVRFVIDSGKVNRMIYHTTGGINRLMETNISQDSAKQRSGRAGRTGPGVSYRMYSEEDFKNFDAFTTAEIHLVPLESLLLQMISLGLTDIQNFPFLEKPSGTAIEESIEKLKFCGALKLNDEHLVLTSLGDALSRLPVDLTIGKMLIMSTVFGNVNSVLAMAAILSVQSPLTQQAYSNVDTQNARKPLESNHGDPISLLNMYKEWLCIKQETAPAAGSSKSKENSRMWARKRGLEEQRFYEITKLIQQFKDILEDAELLPKLTEQDLSSSERAIRHGELKQLRSLRRTLKNEAHSTQRKQLKYDHFGLDSEISGSRQKLDIRDIEFRIINDFKKLQRLLDESSPDSYKDLMMLKLILTSGLYPQIAVEDEFNYSKSVVERLYHAKNTNFIFLRPLSCFNTNPEVLEIHTDDIEVPPPGYFSKRPISRKHQILVFQSILKTKKVYLMNVMRMPAIQTLMLFSKIIATNFTLTTFVFDDFLMIDVPNFGQGKTLLLRAINLRTKWKSMLEQKLKDPTATSKKCNEDIFYFVEDLIKFVTTDISYNIKRLLPADVKVIYSNNKEFPFEKESNPFDANFQIYVNNAYGGLQVTENVVYGCVVQEEWAEKIEAQLYTTPFKCQKCLVHMEGLNLIQIMQHEVICDNKKKSDVKTLHESERVNVTKANSRTFYCENCKSDLMLSPVDILKHRRTCGK